MEGIYDASGNLKARYAYGSWGSIEKIVDASGNSITSSSHIGLLNPSGTGDITRIPSGDCIVSVVDIMILKLGALSEAVIDVGYLAARIIEVAIDPTNLWNWTGVVGDAVDLVPFVTGIGETVRIARANDNMKDRDWPKKHSREGFTIL